MPTKLDHLVIGAATLEQGANYIQQMLGVSVPKGGEHPLMGTHNHLMQLGESCFLEIIAINPDADAPSRPRWYGLDDPTVQRSLQRSPRLLTWAANTNDLASLLSQTHYPFGDATPVTGGDLHWLFAIPKDGGLLGGGMLPNLMQWQTDAHPAHLMVDLNVSLDSLTIHHPYVPWITSILNEIDAGHLVKVEALPANELPYLSASLTTPDGVKDLSSREGV